ncbi:MAG: RidA family protein [Rhodospirillales bacterium]|jgi:2-iminobutanoate/2-iminopropanoate deaminase
MSESFLTLAGQRGINPTSGELIVDPKDRVRQIFKNMEAAAQESGSGLDETVRLVVYVADMKRDRAIVNEAQKELFRESAYPPRSIIEVDYLGDDFIEIDGVFRVPAEDSAALEFLAPKEAFTPTATWSLGVKTDAHVFVSGMRGIHPETNDLVIGEAPRIRRALQNMQMIAEAGGARVTDAIQIVLYVTDEKYLEIIESLQQRLWGDKPLPPMTVNVVTALNDQDIVEIEGTFARM